MKLIQIGISLGVIAFVTWIGDRQRHVAGLAAAMPLTIPLTMWIVFTNTGHDYQKAAEFAGGAITSILGTTVFVIVCYLLLRARLHFGLVLVGGYAAWFAVIALLPQLAQRTHYWIAWLHR